MSGVTGIELGPNYCVLVRGGRAGSQQTVSAASTLMPSAWPAIGRVACSRCARPVSAAICPAARASSRGDPAPRRPNDIAALAALAEAGFEIASVLSPAQALGRMVRARQLGRLHRDSRRRAFVEQSRRRDRDCRRSRGRFAPASSSGRSDAVSRARVPELLDRYLLVSQLAPQLQHVIDLVRPVYGVTVTSVRCLRQSAGPALARDAPHRGDGLRGGNAGLGRAARAWRCRRSFGDSAASLQLAAAVASSGEPRVPVHTRAAWRPI